LRYSNRSILEIQIHILHVLHNEGSMLPTTLMYKTNSSWTVFTHRALPELFMMGLMNKNPLDGSIFITESGITCLDLLERGIQMIRPLKEVFPEREGTRSTDLQDSGIDKDIPDEQT
jgi:predicted transcriptional regulator